MFITKKALCIEYWRFDVGVWEAICVHGSEVSTAYDAHYQARLLGVVLKRNHDSSSLLKGFVFCFVDLQWKKWQDLEMITFCCCTCCQPGFPFMPRIRSWHHQLGNNLHDDHVAIFKIPLKPPRNPFNPHTLLFVQFVKGSCNSLQHSPCWQLCLENQSNIDWLIDAISVVAVELIASSKLIGHVL